MTPNSDPWRPELLSGEHMNFSAPFEEKQLVRMRQRAESAEQLAAEESAKVTALEQLVEQLLEESASLQRKWEARRDAPTPASPSFAPSPLPQAPQPPPPADRDACVGVIMVRLHAGSSTKATEQDRFKTFEICFVVREKRPLLGVEGMQLHTGK